MIFVMAERTALVVEAAWAIAPTIEWRRGARVVFGRARFGRRAERGDTFDHDLRLLALHASELNDAPIARDEIDQGGGRKPVAVRLRQSWHGQRVVTTRTGHRDDLGPRAEDGERSGLCRSEA